MKKVVLMILITLLIGCQRQAKTENLKKIKSKNTLKNKQTTDSFPVLLDGFSYDNVDGEKFSFKEVKGKVLLLDFWSTNCGSCIREHPKLVELEQKINNVDFQVITVSIDRNLEKWKAFINKNNWKGININIDFDPKNPLNKLIYNKPIVRKGDTIYSATIPTYFLIDKNINIIKLDSINENNVEEQIYSLLNKK
jgi:thiol-disulfide isomerase/thioredoxin